MDRSRRVALSPFAALAATVLVAAACSSIPATGATPSPVTSGAVGTSGSESPSPAPLTKLERAARS
ncbi:MAG: hypothetical protein KatS3mg014_2757 [Actinomycetota bacterium]|nr:MAG: hypothetical protein KatS3mg014_2757 [Actinomycetota bacterium]